MSVSLKKEQEVLDYVNEVRKKFDLPEVTSSFGSWWKHYIDERDCIVADAPEYLGYLVDLWKVLREAVHAAGPNSERGSVLTKCCLEVHDRTDAEINLIGTHLELRSNGKLVRRKPYPGSVPRNVETAGPDSS